MRYNKNWDLIIKENKDEEWELCFPAKHVVLIYKSYLQGKDYQDSSTVYDITREQFAFIITNPPYEKQGVSVFPSLLLKKKYKDFNDSEILWYLAIHNQFGYEVSFDQSTEEVEVWRSLPYNLTQKWIDANKESNNGCK